MAFKQWWCPCSYIDLQDKTSDGASPQNPRGLRMIKHAQTCTMKWGRAPINMVWFIDGCEGASIGRLVNMNTI